MPPQPSPQRRPCLECLLSHGKSVQWTRAQRARGSPLVYFLQWYGKFSLEIGKGCLPEWRHIGAGVHSLSWISSAHMMLPNSWLWHLWNIHFALVIRTSSVMIFPSIAKKDISCQIRPFLYREHFWNAFRAKGTPWPTPVLREVEAGHWCLCHKDRRNLFGKEASVAFLSKAALGIESLYWGYCMKQPGFFHSLVFWSFCDGHSALFVWTSPGLLCPTCANKTWSWPICPLLKGEHVWSVFQAMEISLHHTIALRPIGRPLVSVP